MHLMFPTYITTSKLYILASSICVHATTTTMYWIRCCKFLQVRLINDWCRMLAACTRTSLMTASVTREQNHELTVQASQRSGPGATSQKTPCETTLRAAGVPNLCEKGSTSQWRQSTPVVYSIAQRFAPASTQDEKERLSDGGLVTGIPSTNRRSH